MKAKMAAILMAMGSLFVGNVYAADWGGAYGGIQIDAVSLDMSHEDGDGIAVDHSGNGAVFGVHSGYRWDFGNTIVGIKASIDAGSVNGNGSTTVSSSVDSFTLADTYSTKWITMIGGEIGIEPTEDWLVTMAAGVAYINFEVSGRMSSSVGTKGYYGDDTAKGSFAGITVERKLDAASSVYIAYNHLAVSTSDTKMKLRESATFTRTVLVDTDTSAGMITVGYQFQF